MRNKMKPQATPMKAADMRELMSPTGIVHMDGMMGKVFTNWFLIKCGLFGLAAAYGIDWVVMELLP